MKYHYISTRVNLNIFIPNFVCVLTNKRYETYQTCAGVGLGGAPWTSHLETQTLETLYTLITYILNGLDP